MSPYWDGSSLVACMSSYNWTICSSLILDSFSASNFSSFHESPSRASAYFYKCVNVHPIELVVSWFTACATEFTYLPLCQNQQCKVDCRPSDEL